MPVANLISEAVGNAVAVTIMVAGGSVTCITWIREYYKSALDRCRELNAGKTAVEKITKDIDELRRLQEARHDNDAVMGSLIARLQEDCKFLMQHILTGNVPRTRSTLYKDESEGNEK